MQTDDCRLFLGSILEVNNATAVRIPQRPVETKTSPLGFNYNTLNLIVSRSQMSLLGIAAQSEIQSGKYARKRVTKQTGQVNNSDIKGQLHADVDKQITADALWQYGQ